VVDIADLAVALQHVVERTGYCADREMDTDEARRSCVRDNSSNV